MSKKVWVEVICNNCGCAEHYPPPCTNADLVEDGWNIRRGRHYCSPLCLRADLNLAWLEPRKKGTKININ